MAKIQNLREVEIASPPPRSAARVELAERIKTRDDAKARLVALGSAIDRARENVWRATAARDALVGSIESARTDHARAATNAMIAGTPAPAPSLPSLRAALQAAEDDLAAATTARETIITDMAELRAGAPLREMQVEDVVAAVLRAEAASGIAALTAELGALHLELVDKTLALRALIRANGCATRTADGDHFSPTAAAVNRFESLPMTWDIAQHPTNCRTLAAWEATIASLRASADAALPA